VADVEADAVPFAERFAALTAELERQSQESDRLQEVIRQNLKAFLPLAEH
jgi:type I restriction enzyme M protein